ncbi:MAG TPA: hypothetical protein VKM55_22070 [Candidatus Lokiarchaeia archaeon]|nr:hypothetical protein [Candidatus Lokiarchaeia archaeon]
MKPVLVLTIILFSGMLIINPGSASPIAPQQVNQPWSISSGWAFTWHINDATTPYMRGTDMRFTVNQIVPVVVNDQLSSMNFEGNLSRNIELYPGQGASWQDMKINTTYARYDVNTGIYAFTADAFSDDVFFLPIGLQNPMQLFKDAYSSQCNDTAWTITMNETTRTYDATNITNARQKVHIDFDPNGAIQNATILWSNGSIKYQMILNSVYNPNADIARFFNIITIALVGVIILLAVVALLRKYKINVKDVISGRRHALEPVDNELDSNETSVDEVKYPEKDG